MRDNYAAFVVDKAVGVVASHADVLRLVMRSSWGGTRDKPKNVCVGGYYPGRFECNVSNTRNSVSLGYPKTEIKERRNARR